MFDCKKVEAAIGYTFRDKRLLETALTHASFVNEHGGKSYERLEFLGDSILNFIVADGLYRTSDLSEGKLTVLRAQTVSRKPLAAAVGAMGLQNYMRIGCGMEHEHVSEKSLSDLFESVLGAIYIDSGSLAPCRAFTARHLVEASDEDYKSRLQEVVQRSSRVLPQYECVSDGAGFCCRVVLDGKEVGCGRGVSKKAAEQQAARLALDALGK